MPLRPGPLIPILGVARTTRSSGTLLTNGVVDSPARAHAIARLKGADPCG
jgi:hypothetical protein